MILFVRRERSRQPCFHDFVFLLFHLFIYVKLWARQTRLDGCDGDVGIWRDRSSPAQNKLTALWAFDLPFRFNKSGPAFAHPAIPYAFRKRRSGRRPRNFTSDFRLIFWPPIKGMWIAERTLQPRMMLACGVQLQRQVIRYVIGLAFHTKS